MQVSHNSTCPLEAATHWSNNIIDMGLAEKLMHCIFNVDVIYTILLGFLLPTYFHPKFS